MTGGNWPAEAYFARPTNQDLRFSPHAIWTVMVLYISGFPPPLFGPSLFGSALHPDLDTGLISRTL